VRASLVLATLGVFLRAFLLVAVSGPLVPRIRKSKMVSRFDGYEAELDKLAGERAKVKGNVMVRW